MKRTLRISFLIALLGLIIINFSISVQAQVIFELGVSEDDVYTWEITELSKHNFEKVFGFEPFYDVGDEIRMKIERIIESTSGSNTVVVEFWDYGSDWNEKGSIKYFSVPATPSDYEDNLFIMTPVERFLEEAMGTLPNSYSLQGSTVTKLSQNYTTVLEYHSKGILLSETYIDDDDIVMIKVEGKFRIIPFGNVFLVIILISIISVVLKIIKKNNLRIKDF